jgi:hypothetical protein
MKRKLIVFFLLILSVSAVYAQRIPVVGIVAFDVGSAGVTAADAANLTSRVISELSSWGTMNIVQGTAGAEFVIRGSLSRQGGAYVLSATTSNANSGQTLNEYREQGAAINNISIFLFCTKAVERVPFPNYLLGKWQATINMPDGPVVCIIEFKSDRTVQVERYDTWEHRQNNSLRYEGYGTGSYFYAGYANRTITVNSRQIRIDATVSVNLNLEETLPEQTDVNIGGLSLVFNGEKTTFEIVNGSLPCGRNFDGPSVYPSASIGFSQFTKIR